ncbi:unnamed protein product [Miscanthus lutarioriparius]|uniref:Uncharacterized protein n=1 Tax=Miscanthus lutarioriparius TaxID=422564 RepID=A0A811MDT0_9POAL|nr:unnamed protein product [Miscanthus lutarioriparius]
MATGKGTRRKRRRPWRWNRSPAAQAVAAAAATSLFCLGGWILFRRSLASLRIFSAVIWIGAGHRTALPDTAAGAAPCPGRAIAAESKGPFPVESALLVPEWRRGGGSRRRGETKRWMASCADGSSVAERPWLGEARRRRYLAGQLARLSGDKRG